MSLCLSPLGKLHTLSAFTFAKVKELHQNCQVVCRSAEISLWEEDFTVGRRKREQNSRLTPKFTQV